MRHLDFIAQFSTDIRHLPGEENVVANALSRIDSLSQPLSLSYAEIARAQKEDNELQNMVKSGSSRLKLKPVLVDDTGNLIMVDISTGREQVYLPAKFRYNAFFSVHKWSHLGPKTTAIMVSKCYVWPGTWAKACMA